MLPFRTYWDILTRQRLWPMPGIWASRSHCVTRFPWWPPPSAMISLTTRRRLNLWELGNPSSSRRSLWRTWRRPCQRFSTIKSLTKLLRTWAPLLAPGKKWWILSRGEKKISISCQQFPFQSCVVAWACDWEPRSVDFETFLRQDPNINHRRSKQMNRSLFSSDLNFSFINFQSVTCRTL